MAILKGDLQDDLGNILYPNTSIEQVEGFTSQFNKITGGLDVIPQNFLKAYPKKFYYQNEGKQNLNDIKENFMSYTTTADALINLPPGYGGGAGFLMCYQVYNNQDTCHTVQEFIHTTANLRFYRSYNRDVDVWTDWQQVATTTKVPFSCTAISGYTIYSQDCYTLNDTSYVRIVINKTDGSNMDTVPKHVFTSPKYPTHVTSGNITACLTNTGTTAVDGGTVNVSTSGKCYMICPSDSKSAIISFVIG